MASFENLRRFCASARERLEEAAWEAAWAEGRAMTPAQAVAYALEDDQALPTQLLRA